MRTLFLYLTGLCLLLFLSVTSMTSAGRAMEGQAAQVIPSYDLFLPLIRQPTPPVYIINAPHFSGEVVYQETAIHWFGQISPVSNYSDIRIGYNDEILFVNLNVIDQFLWYSNPPSSQNLLSWDSASLLLDTTDEPSDHPGQTSFRFDAQLNHTQPREEYQAAYQGNGSGWAGQPLDFTTVTGWRGSGINDGAEARGWNVTFFVPFTSLGMTGPPAEGDIWRLGIKVYDRDNASGVPILESRWPTNEANPQDPQSWGHLRFGIPAYLPAPTGASGTTVIQQGLNNSVVVDGHVGGHTICGQDYYPDFFNGWGEANYAGYPQVNVQNQYDVADWPCFSKYYLRFPLDPIPPGKIITSATLTVYQFSNAGGGTYGPPPDSYIQALMSEENWSENTLTWNNAPPALENLSGTWVYPILPGEPDVARQWDVSRAVALAYPEKGYVDLILYSADNPQHSGRYFLSSDAGDWIAEERPSLTVVWGDPLP